MCSLFLLTFNSTDWVADYNVVRALPYKPDNTDLLWPKNEYSFLVGFHFFIDLARKDLDIIYHYSE